jgi:hypothetical protein
VVCQICTGEDVEKYTICGIIKRQQQRERDAMKYLLWVCAFQGNIAVCSPEPTVYPDIKACTAVVQVRFLEMLKQPSAPPSLMACVPEGQSLLPPK